MGMEKIRSKRKLLKILLYHFKILGFSGLCIAIEFIYKDNHINYTEKQILSSLIYREIKAPSLYNRIFHSTTTRKDCDRGYFWVAYDKKPRIKFLNYLLKKYKDERI